MTILSSDYVRIMFGLSSNRLSIGGSNSRSFQYLVRLEADCACSAHCK